VLRLKSIAVMITIVPSNTLKLSDTYDLSPIPSSLITISIVKIKLKISFATISIAYLRGLIGYPSIANTKVLKIIHTKISVLK
jgi:hypothetical protein